MDYIQYDEQEILKIIKKLEYRIKILESQNKEINLKLSELQKLSDDKISKKDFERKIGNF